MPLAATGGKLMSDFVQSLFVMRERDRKRSVFVVWSAMVRCNQLNDILVSKSWHLAGPSLDGPGSSVLSIR